MLGFRVWDSREKRMVYSFRKIDDPDFLMGLDGSLLLPYANHRCSEEYIPMQFTGVRDCQGQLIYEGDVLVIKAESNPEMGIYLILCHRIVDDVTEFLRWLGSMEPVKFIEIIGNRFENPEISSIRYYPPILDIPLDEFCSFLPDSTRVRIYNALSSEGITKLGQICASSERSLNLIVNMGDKCFKDIQIALEELNLSTSMPVAKMFFESIKQLRMLKIGV